MVVASKGEAHLATNPFVLGVAYAKQTVGWNFGILGEPKLGKQGGMVREVSIINGGPYKEGLQLRTHPEKILSGFSLTSGERLGT